MRHRAQPRAARPLPRQVLPRSHDLHRLRRGDHLLLSPWAVVYRELGAFGLVSMVIFAALVFESFVYLDQRTVRSSGARSSRFGTPWPVWARWARSGPARPPCAGSASTVACPRSIPGRPKTTAEQRSPEPRSPEQRKRWLHESAGRGIPRQGPRRSPAQLRHRHPRGAWSSWSRARSCMAGHVRTGLLRARDDGHRRRPLRPRPLRHGDLPRLAPPGRPDDRRRAGQPEDGPGPAPDLRPDDGAQVGHLDGRVRLVAAGCSTTTPSCRASTRSSPSTSTPRAARPGPADAHARHPHAARQDPDGRALPDGARRTEGAPPSRWPSIDGQAGSTMVRSGAVTHPRPRREPGHLTDGGHRREPSSTTLVKTVTSRPRARSSTAGSCDVTHVDRGDLLATVTELYDEGFTVCLDVTAASTT